MACKLQPARPTLTSRASAYVRERRALFCAQTRRGLTGRKALKTSDGTLCTLQAQCAQQYRLDHEGASFHEYLQQIELRLPRFQLPLGAALEVAADGTIMLNVPRVTFFDLWVLPTSTLAVTHGEQTLSIRAVDTTVKGSHHVSNLRCNDRFDLALKVRLDQAVDRCAVWQALHDTHGNYDFPFALVCWPLNCMSSTHTRLPLAHDTVWHCVAVRRCFLPC